MPAGSQLERDTPLVHSLAVFMRAMRLHAFVAGSRDLQTRSTLAAIRAAQLLTRAAGAAATMRSPPPSDGLIAKLFGAAVHVVPFAVDPQVPAASRRASLSGTSSAAAPQAAQPW